VVAADAHHPAHERDELIRPQGDRKLGASREYRKSISYLRGKPEPMGRSNMPGFIGKVEARNNLTHGSDLALLSKTRFNRKRERARF
jgi:hypothetical protein